MTKTICAVLLLTGSMISFVLQAQEVPSAPNQPTSGFTLSIAAKSPFAEIGKVGPISVTEKNDTDHVINNGRGGDTPCHWYRMEVLLDGKQVPKTADLIRREQPAPKGLHYEAGPMLSTISPGEENGFRVPVSECYDMSVPGTYEITFIWERADPKNPEKIIQTKSNTISIIVLPPDPSVEEPK